jgi:hypothetical protein
LGGAVCDWAPGRGSIFVNIVITVERGALSRRSLESGASELVGVWWDRSQLSHAPANYFYPKWELFRTEETIDYVNERRRIPKL